MLIYSLHTPETRQFMKDETIVKIERKPFTHGAMRHCFRVRKIALISQLVPMNCSSPPIISDEEACHASAIRNQPSFPQLRLEPSVELCGKVVRALANSLGSFSPQTLTSHRASFILAAT